MLFILLLINFAFASHCQLLHLFPPFSLLLVVYLQYTFSYFISSLIFPIHNEISLKGGFVDIEKVSLV